MSAEMRERLMGNPGPRPTWVGSEIPKHGFVPVCSEECSYHDGKRCELLGHRPSHICEPAVERMSEALDVIEKTVLP